VGPACWTGRFLKLQRLVIAFVSWFANVAPAYVSAQLGLFRAALGAEADQSLGSCMHRSEDCKFPRGRTAAKHRLRQRANTTRVWGVTVWYVVMPQGMGPCASYGMEVIMNPVQ
jgi:hypothetical protein